jgi:hypothetical protein
MDKKLNNKSLTPMDLLLLSEKAKSSLTNTSKDGIEETPSLA